MSRPKTQQTDRAVPSQDRAKDTVNVLLEATEEVARKVGFEEATTKEIAQVAGVSAGTLYRYFPDKEALLVAVIRRQWEAGVQEFGAGIALMKPGGFDEIVESIVHLAFNMITSRLEAFGRMKIGTDNVVHLGAEMIDNAAILVRGALERRKADIQVEDLEVASLIVVRSVVFLARIGVRDYGPLIESGRYPKEIATMVRRYLVKPLESEALAVKTRAEPEPNPHLD
jgi:AcrR family transcriptional regulator